MKLVGISRLLGRSCPTSARIILRLLRSRRNKRRSPNSLRRVARRATAPRAALVQCPIQDACTRFIVQDLPSSSKVILRQRQLMTVQGFMHLPLSRTHLLRWQSGPCIFHRPYHGQSGQSGGASGDRINPRLSLMGISEWQLTRDSPPGGWGGLILDPSTSAERQAICCTPISMLTGPRLGFRHADQPARYRFELRSEPQRPPRSGEHTTCHVERR
jgi:hypothetical protein